MPGEREPRDVPSRPPTVVVVDVDGVVSPIHGPTDWGDDVHAGHLFGPVTVSPAMCARLDALEDHPDVACLWLTSWTPKMRAAMDPFPGRSWPPIADGRDIGRIRGRRWWKLTALIAWLEQHPETSRLAWCDDDLRPPARRGMVLRELERRGLPARLFAPRTAIGLTQDQMTRLESWAGTSSQD